MSFLFDAAFSMTTFWIVAMVVLLIVEAAVPGLVSIWFAIGSLAAFFSALFLAPIWLQVTWFFVVSVACLILTRPFAKKYVNSRTTPTNADMIIGKDCVVTEDIDNIRGVGAVSVGGKIWSARTEEPDRRVQSGTTMTVLRIEGVKLIVK